MVNRCAAFSSEAPLTFALFSSGTPLSLKAKRNDYDETHLGSS